MLNIRYTSPTKLSSVQYDRMDPPSLDLPSSFIWGSVTEMGGRVVYLVYVKLGRAYVLPTLNIREVCTGGGMRGGGEDKGDSSTPLDGRGVLSTREEEAHGENSMR